MNEIAILIIAVAVLISAGFLVSALIEFRKTTRRLNEFLDAAEKDLPPTINELRYTLENLKLITGNIRSVTDGVRELSETLTDTAKNIRSISKIVGTVGTETNATIAGIKAGIKTAFGVLVKNIVSAQPRSEKKERKDIK